MSKEILDDIIRNFTPEKFRDFFRDKNRNFSPREEELNEYDTDIFSSCHKIGEIKFENQNMLFVHIKTANELTERSSKKKQYELAKKILKDLFFDTGIFIFYDVRGNFRFSLVYTNYISKKRDWSNFRRFTYYVNRELTNKTFLKQIGAGDFGTLEKIKSAFSITAVTDIFYNEFFQIYEKIVNDVIINNKNINEQTARDFVLLFAIRIIFIGFIQKKGWIGSDIDFLNSFFKEYKNLKCEKNTFYSDWLCILFFNALNSFGRKEVYFKSNFSKETGEILQLAPYLNGGLFRTKQGYDDKEYFITDNSIDLFFEFLFSHSFTIEENSFEDEDLQLNPEFLGIIFERIVNKADGAVYTPRTEVDFMCRLTLVKWLEKNTSSTIEKQNLYELFFKEIGDEKNPEDYQKSGSFSKKEANEIIDLLSNISICDPAVGSGAFVVGILQVIDEIFKTLSEKYIIELDSDFERRKKIISNSLYGVEVKEWAVWICQLRLWISLFIDAPDELKSSPKAILPSLEFKIRQGDSLMQRIGSKMFPVMGHAVIGKSIKSKITELKNLKTDYFYNKSEIQELYVKQNEIKVFNSILDEEIEESKDEIKRKQVKKVEIKTDLFGREDKSGYQDSIKFNEEELEQLNSRLTELREQKNNIKNDKPLIWNIEFAEIFTEKGGFDIVIGNPPYVRQEKIEDPTGKISDKKEYKNLLQEMVRLDFNDYFKPKVKIDAKSDLYTYFYIRSLRLLNKNGYLCFICSNSWLDVGYGVWLQKFLLDRCPVDFIIDNHSKRSFESADINTIISLIQAPFRKPDENHKVKFIAFKKPFEEVIFTENLLDIENIDTIKINNNFRAYPITTKELRESGMEYENEESGELKKGNYVGDKWGGKYLRAPKIMIKFFKSNELMRFNDFVNIKYGLKTGNVDFFYINEDIIKKYKIEKEFYYPIITSSQNLDTLFVKANEFLFSSHLSENELKKTNAFKYIQYGESVGVNRGVSVRSHRPYWYSLNFENINVLFLRFWDKRFWSPIVSHDSTCSDNFCYGNFKINEYCGKILVNSTFYFLQIELYGRDNQGQGVLTTYMEFDYPFIRMPNLKEDNDKYINILDKINKRKIKTIFDECGINPESETPIEGQEPNPLPDRAELDKIVFDALELTEKERKEIYRAVCRLVWNRISKAKNV